MRVEIRNLTKTFDAYKALDQVSLDVREGEFCALLGPSGSGKTTLLRIIAGLEFPNCGEVRFAGEDMVRRDARERQVGFVFQHYALFRHMSVFENVAFGLRVRPRRVRPAEAQIRERVMELLRLVQLKRFANRYPNQLSGGQRQRVALARALAIEPRILLLDEPFGALDAKVRKDLRRWLRDLHRRLGLTSVFVTHDQEEALELADQVVLMREGKIEQIGSPREIYDRPATPFVYEFLGSANRLPCHVQAGRIGVAGGWFEPPYGTGIGDGPAWLFVRPHDLEVERNRAHAGDASSSRLRWSPRGRRTGSSSLSSRRTPRSRRRWRKPASTRSGSPLAHRSSCARWSSGCSPPTRRVLQSLRQPICTSLRLPSRSPGRRRFAGRPPDRLWHVETATAGLTILQATSTATCVVRKSLKARHRGRNGDCSPPPAQIPACGTTAPGSCLGSLRRTASRDRGAVASRWQPALRGPHHLPPRKPVPLASSRQAAQPVGEHVVVEGVEGTEVGPHGVVVVEAVQHQPQIAPLLRDSHIHHPAQGCLDLQASLPSATTPASGSASRWRRT